jgi:hypothetical protein
MLMGAKVVLFGLSVGNVKRFDRTLKDPCLTLSGR